LLLICPLPTLPITAFCCSFLLLVQLGGPGGVPEQGVLLSETKLFLPPVKVSVRAAGMHV
jgi:hypothetical protein